MHRRIERDMSPSAQQRAHNGRNIRDGGSRTQPLRLADIETSIPEAQHHFAAGLSGPDGYQCCKGCAGQGVKEAVRRFAREKEIQDRFEIDQAVGQGKRRPTDMFGRNRLDECARAEMERRYRHVYENFATE